MKTLSKCGEVKIISDVENGGEERHGGESNEYYPWDASFLPQISSVVSVTDRRKIDCENKIPRLILHSLSKPSRHHEAKHGEKEVTPRDVIIKDLHGRTPHTDLARQHGVGGSSRQV